MIKKKTKTIIVNANGNFSVEYYYSWKFYIVIVSFSVSRFVLYYITWRAIINDYEMVMKSIYY